jgi:hypothetical protein
MQQTRRRSPGGAERQNRRALAASRVRYGRSFRERRRGTLGTGAGSGVQPALRACGLDGLRINFANGILIVGHQPDDPAT